MSDVNLPNIREPFIDQRSGQISRPWWIWLQQLMNRIGGTDSADLTAIVALLNAARLSITDLERKSGGEWEAAQSIAELYGLFDMLQAAIEGKSYSHGQWDDPDMHAEATTSASGFMSSPDKTKLDGILASTAISNFRAYQSSAQSISADTWTTVSLQTEEFDDLGEFSTSTYQFVPASTGTYSFAGGVRGTQTTVNIRGLAIYVNGSEIGRAHV